MSVNKRFDFFGTLINATNLDETVTFLKDYDYRTPAYISFPDSFVVATAQNDQALKDILNNSLLTLPDGKPSEMYARLKGFKGVSTVSGYWLCKHLLNTTLTHYFLGSTDDKLKKIAAIVEADFPQARVVGYHSPSFHDISFFEQGNVLEGALKEINEHKPDLIWIGLSSPKQDFLMRTHVTKINQGVLLGVGGVFDYLSGDVKKSPEWVKKIGMRWLWRLVKEPRRLGSKYWLTLRVFSGMLLKR